MLILIALPVWSLWCSTGAAAAGRNGFPVSIPPEVRLFYSGLVLPRNEMTPLGFADSAQPAARDSVHVSRTKVALIAGTMAAAIVTIHLYQQSGWWRDNRTSFHFQEDLVYGLNVDKFGHFYGADLLRFSIAKTLVWADMPEDHAMWYGAGGALLFQTYVEIEDGFSTWGFDRVDWASDLAGAAWGPLRHAVPAFRSIDMKLSYHPSDLLGHRGGAGFKGQKHLMIDDYEGQTIWFSLDMTRVLPGTAGDHWPGWLRLAMGYGAREVAGPSPHRVYFIAPDLEMTRIIPQTSTFLKTLSEALNYIHMPLPAVMVSPGTIWYGLYF